MHDDHFVLIRGYETAAGGVRGDPALLLADVEQHRVYALLGGRAGIQVVGKYFVAVVQAVVYNNLLALEVGMAERGRNVNDRARLIALALLGVDKALQVRQREREKRALLGAHEHRAVAIDIAARVERHQDQFLCLEPVHRFLTQVGERIAVNVRKALFVGRLVVRNAHAVRLAAAHIVLHEVDRGAVLAAGHVRLLDRALAGHVEHDIVNIHAVGAEDHVIQLRLAGRHGYALAMLDDIGQLIRKGEFRQQRVHLFVSSFSHRRALPKPQAMCPKTLLKKSRLTRPIVLHL